MWKVKVDGRTVKSFDQKDKADNHAAILNQQLLMMGQEAYVEFEEDQ